MSRRFSVFVCVAALVAVAIATPRAFFSIGTDAGGEFGEIVWDGARDVRVMNSTRGPTVRASSLGAHPEWLVGRSVMTWDGTPDVYNDGYAYSAVDLKISTSVLCAGCTEIPDSYYLGLDATWERVAGQPIMYWHPFSAKVGGDLFSGQTRLERLTLAQRNTLRQLINEVGAENIYFGGSFGNADLGRGEQATISLEAAPELRENDFDGDGSMDLLFRHRGDGRVLVWTMNGAQRSGWRMLNPDAVRTNWTLVGSGDFNGDLKADIVWQDENDGWLVVWYLDQGVRIGWSYLNPSRVLDPEWKVAGIADMNSDMKADLIFRHRLTGMLAVWLMDGTTATFRGNLNPAQVATEWEIVGNGDFNGDLNADILWRNRLDGSLRVWMMKGITLESSVPLTPGRILDLNWDVVATGDLNGDLQPDLVFQHTDGALAAWYMNGVTRQEFTHISPAAVVDTSWRIFGPK